MQIFVKNSQELWLDLKLTYFRNNKSKVLTKAFGYIAKIPRVYLNIQLQLTAIECIFRPTKEIKGGEQYWQQQESIKYLSSTISYHERIVPYFLKAS